MWTRMVCDEVGGALNVRCKIYATLAWVAVMPLCTSPANGQIARKFCENVQYLSYDEDRSPSKDAKYYVIKLPQSSYVDKSDFGSTISVLEDISAKSYYGRLSMDGPPSLECSASGIGDGNFDNFKDFSCRSFGASSTYDPTIGVGLEFDENDSSSESACPASANNHCFIIKDKSGSRYLTMADSLLHPLLRYMTSPYYEIVTDGTTDGIVRVYTKQFAFSRGGNSYLLIGYEEQGGLKCTFERAPEPQF